MRNEFLIIFVSLIMPLLAWGAKYDYVRLKINPSISEKTLTATDQDGFVVNYFAFEFVELKEGEAAKVVSFPQFKTAGISSLLTYDSVKYLVFESELGIFSYSLYPNMTLIPKYDITIVGPGKIYAAENQGTAGENYDSNASVTLQIDRPEYNSFEYRKIPIELSGEYSVITENGTTVRYYGDGLILQNGDVVNVVGSANLNHNDKLMLDTGTEKIQYQVERLIGTSTEPDLNNMIVGGGVLHASLDEPIINSSQTTKGYIDLKIKRAAKSGSQTLAWNGSVWESPLANSDGSSGSDSNGVKMTNFRRVYFTDTLGFIHIQMVLGIICIY